MISIKIDTDNAAFEDSLAGEVKRILSTVEGDIDQLLRDFNGNKVGEVTIT